MNFDNIVNKLVLHRVENSPCKLLSTFDSIDPYETRAVVINNNMTYTPLTKNPKEGLLSDLFIHKSSIKDKFYPVEYQQINKRFYIVDNTVNIYIPLPYSDIILDNYKVIFYDQYFQTLKFDNYSLSLEIGNNKFDLMNLPKITMQFQECYLIISITTTDFKWLYNGFIKATVDCLHLATQLRKTMAQNSCTSKIFYTRNGFLLPQNKQNKTHMNRIYGTSDSLSISHNYHTISNIKVCILDEKMETVLDNSITSIVMTVGGFKVEFTLEEFNKITIPVFALNYHDIEFEVNTRQPLKSNEHFSFTVIGSPKTDAYNIDTSINECPNMVWGNFNIESGMVKSEIDVMLLGWHYVPNPPKDDVSDWQCTTIIPDTECIKLTNTTPKVSEWQCTTITPDTERIKLQLPQ